MLRKIYFMIHPLTYIDHREEYSDQAAFEAYLAYENKIASKWYKAISNMGDDEALLIVPSRPPTKSMRDLEEFAQRELGPRCIITCRVSLDGDGSPSVAKEFWEGMKEESLLGIGEDLKTAFIAQGSGDWIREDLTTTIQARRYVADLKAGLAAGGYSIDSKTVQAESWGESFDGCVAKYSCAMGKLLNFSNPIENNAEMTVPDALFIIEGRFVERVPLEGFVRLFLFEGSDGRPIGVFLEGFHTVRDKPRFVIVPVDPGEVEVKFAHPSLWQDTQHAVRALERRLQVPIGVGLLGMDPVYLLGNELSFAEFRAVLVTGTVTE